MKIDLEKIIELDRLNMEEFFEASGLQFDPEKRREGLLKEIEKGAVFITVERDGCLIGYIEYIVEGDGNAYVPSIMVHPDYKGGLFYAGCFQTPIIV